MTNLGNKRILITGGLGFLGSNFVNHLIEKGAENIFIVDNSENIRSRFTRVNGLKRVRFMKADIRDKRLELILGKRCPDVVAHLAALHYIPECEENPREVFDTNVFGTYNVVRMANILNAKHFIFTSSASVYDMTRKAQLRENDKTMPQTVYGISKVLGEEIIKKYCKIPWTIFRVFNIFGPNDTTPHLIETILNQARKSEKLLLGNLKTKRDYIFVEDLCKALSSAIFNVDCFGEVINIGSGKATSARGIVKIVAQKLRARFTIEVDPQRLRKKDPAVICADITKAKKLLKWSSLTMIDAGLEKLIEHKNMHKAHRICS